MIKQRILCGILLCAVLLGTAACGKTTEEAVPVSTSADAVTTVSATEPEPKYAYPEADYKGYTFRILNSVNYYGARCEMDFKGSTGEVLNDAIYDRNRGIEERYKIKVKVEDYDTTTTSFDAVIEMAQKSVLAQDDNWDAMYLSGYKLSPMLTSGALLNLNEVSGLQLDKPWWDTTIIEKIQLGSKLFFATGAAHLMAYDMTECIYFNEQMVKDRKLELPYQLVRDGKWTLDVLKEYCVAAASLNGAGSWAWDQNAKTVYGISTHPTNSANKLLCTMGVNYVTIDGDNVTFMKDAEWSYSVLDKLASLYNTTAGVSLKADWDDLNAAKGGYVYVFREERAMFLTAAFKTASSLREMTSDYGILPYPKYDEKQENYSAFEGISSLGMTIPVTNKDVARTATIMDALSFDSYENVMPAYYDVTLSHKLLRNEDSIEMLKLVFESRTTDLALVYSWVNDFVNALNSKLYQGDSDFASTIASNRSKVESTVSDFLKSIG